MTYTGAEVRCEKGLVYSHKVHCSSGFMRQGVSKQRPEWPKLGEGIHEIHQGFALLQAPAF